MNLDAINERMIAEGQYNNRDLRDMQKISMLRNKNDYDYYLIICALCNYNIPEKKELLAMRMEYFNKVNDSKEDYSHNPEDYEINIDKLKIQCKNTGNINKFGLYEYEINSDSKDLVSVLWEYKGKDCLKYVDNKTYKDKIIVSISKNQLTRFMGMLDTLTIGYDSEDLQCGMVHNNRSGNSLVDISKLTLPFTPYEYQIEDATNIVKMKRALIGHEMGCISGDGIVNVLENNNIVNIELKELYNKSNVNNLKIKSYIKNSNTFDFMPIKAVLNKGIQSIVKITTTNSTIKCTADHNILTTLGWKEAINLNTEDIIISDNNQIELVKSIDTVSKEMVYDVAIDSVLVSNFIVNNLVVHNCGKTFISVLVGTSIGKQLDITYNTMDELNYDDIVITDKGPLPIGKIVEENIDCKVQVVKNNEITYVNITDRSCIEY